MDFFMYGLSDQLPESHLIWYLTAEGATSISGHLYLYIRGAHISTVTRRVSSPPGDHGFFFKFEAGSTKRKRPPHPRNKSWIRL